MSCCRPKRSPVRILATRDAWATSAIVGPAETAAPFSLSNPTGPAIVAVRPIDGANRTGDQPPFLLITPGIYTPGNALDNIPFSSVRDHEGTPTILYAFCSVANRGGSVRYWVCATQDLQNGVWAEVTHVTNLTGRRLLGSDTIAIRDDLPADDGQGNEFTKNREGIPVNVTERILRLAYGYTVDGQETKVGETDFLTATYDNTLSGCDIELAVDADLVSSNANPQMVRAASVLIAANQQNLEEVAAFSFDIDRRAASSVQRQLQSRTAIIQVKPSDVANQPALSTPRVFLADAVQSRFSSIPMKVNERPTGIVTYNPTVISGVSEVNLAAQNFAGIWGRVYEESDLALRPDAGDFVGFAVKNAPCWHEQRLVSHGTLRAVDGARQSITFTTPDRQSTISANVTGGLELGLPRYNITPQNIFRTMVQANTFTVMPEINGRPLAPCSYWGVKEFPEVSISGTSNLIAYEFTLSGRIEVGVKTFIEFVKLNGNNALVNKRLAFESQYPTLASAIAAGIDQDTHWFYARRGASFFARQISDRDGCLRIYSQVAYKIVFTRVGEWAGNYQVHREGGVNITQINFSNADCVRLADGETLTGFFSGAHYGTQLGAQSGFSSQVTIA